MSGMTREIHSLTQEYTYEGELWPTWGIVPFTSAGMSSLVYPTAPSPSSTCRSNRIWRSVSARTAPASSLFTCRISAPEHSAEKVCYCTIFKEWWQFWWIWIFSIDSWRNKELLLQKNKERKLLFSILDFFKKVQRALKNLIFEYLQYS